MVTAFLVSWAPYAVISLYKVLGGGVGAKTSVIPLLFAKSSICWNPFIYVFMNTQVQKNGYTVHRKNIVTSHIPYKEQKSKLIYSTMGT